MNCLGNLWATFCRLWATFCRRWATFCRLWATFYVNPLVTLLAGRAAGLRADLSAKIVAAAVAVALAAVAKFFPNWTVTQAEKDAMAQIIFVEQKLL